MKNEYKYIIKTNSRLLVEFAQTPEGMARIILVITVPFWGIAYLVRKLLGDKK